MSASDRRADRELLETCRPLWRALEAEIANPGSLAALSAEQRAELGRCFRLTCEALDKGSRSLAGGATRQ
jgi:hypothetical protein